jgi:hypothetical protein
LRYKENGSADMTDTALVRARSVSGRWVSMITKREGICRVIDQAT